MRGIVEGNECFPTQAKVPRFYQADHLKKLHPSAKHVQIDAARAKRFMLEAFAFMSWWTTIAPEWEVDLSEGLAERVISYTTTVKGRRGVICDLERDWPIINVPLYVHNKIPFFYLWNFEARSDTRFSRLNPALNMTYWAIRQGSQLQLPQELEDEDLNKVTRHATKLDKFFQDVFGYTQSSDPFIRPYYATFIIDFEGWKRRPIKNYSEEAIATLAKLYYYTVLDEDDNVTGCYPIQ